MQLTLFRTSCTTSRPRLIGSVLPGFGGTFSPIYVVLLGRLFPKTIGFTHEWTEVEGVKIVVISFRNIATNISHRMQDTTILIRKM